MRHSCSTNSLPEAVGSGSVSDALRKAVGEAMAAPLVVAPWTLLFSGIFDSLSRAGRFAQVVVLDANAFPVLGLHRCFPLARGRLVLVGSSLAAGPWCETAGATASPLYQNTVRLLADAGAHLLPESVKRFAVVHLSVRLPEGLKALARGPAIALTTPAPTIRIVEGEAGPAQGCIELRQEIRPTEDTRARLRVTLAPVAGHHLPNRQLRTLLRLVPAVSLERLDGAEPGRTDSRLLGVPVRVSEIQRLISIPNHEIILRLPEARAPLTLREGLANAAEAAAAVEIVRAGQHGSSVATSPFVAQCRELAEAAAKLRVSNLRVVVPERLGQKKFSKNVHLILSFAATRPEDVAGWPFADLGRLLPLFVGEWAGITVVCSPAMARHPVLRSLVEVND
jgi:hypothetical protein